MLRSARPVLVVALAAASLSLPAAGAASRSADTYFSAAENGIAQTKAAWWKSGTMGICRSCRECTACSPIPTARK